MREPLGLADLVFRLSTTWWIAYTALWECWLRWRVKSGFKRRESHCRCFEFLSGDFDVFSDQGKLVGEIGLSSDGSLLAEDCQDLWGSSCKLTSGFRNDFLPLPTISFTTKP